MWTRSAAAGSPFTSTALDYRPVPNAVWTQSSLLAFFPGFSLKVRTNVPAMQSPCCHCFLASGSCVGCVNHLLGCTAGHLWGSAWAVTTRSLGRLAGTALRGSPAISIGVRPPPTTFAQLLAGAVGAVTTGACSASSSSLAATATACFIAKYMVGGGLANLIVIVLQLRPF